MNSPNTPKSLWVHFEGPSAVECVRDIKTRLTKGGGEDQVDALITPRIQMTGEVERENTNTWLKDLVMQAVCQVREVGGVAVTHSLPSDFRETQWPDVTIDTSDIDNWDLARDALYQRILEAAAHA